MPPRLAAGRVRPPFRRGRMSADAKPMLSEYCQCHTGLSDRRKQAERRSAVHSRYHFSANEIEGWVKVRWYSDNFGEAFGLDLPVTITAKPTVWALANGTHFCTFWHSEWEGILSVFGEQLINVGVLKVCAAP